MAKKKGVLSTILKIVFGILGVIVLIVVGGYCYFKYVLGFDIIDVTNKLKLVSQSPVESEIVTNPYQNKDVEDILNTMFGTNDFVLKEGDDYKFDLEVFAQQSLQTDIELTDKHLASLFSAFLNSADPAKIGIDKAVLDNIFLSQIKFSNFEQDSTYTSADINFIFGLSLDQIKDEYTKDNALLSFVANAFLPDKVYVSSTFNVQIPKDDFRSYTITRKSFAINNLNQEDTNRVLEILTLVLGEENTNNFVDSINTTFCDALFGGNGKTGMIEYIQGATNIEFTKDIDEIKIFIKKV
ncbi:MAG: hypothetical protein IJD48_00210 [Clostridia bacterium]|nr:hypothetical protein [Clostridia bacterium]